MKTKIKKFSRIIYVLMMALLVLSLSGCHHKDDDNNSSNDNKTVASGKFIGIKAPSLRVGEDYKIYKGQFRVAGTNAKYYVAPIELEDDETIAAINLEFTDLLSNEALVITTSDDEANAVFAYNPAGTVSYDVDTPYGGVYRFGGTRMEYTSLNLSTSAASSVKASALNVDTSDVIDIILNGSSATAAGTSVPVYNYVWHADPNHINEYFTLNDGTAELTEDEMLANIVSTSGVYINHDIRYLSDTLNFTYLDTENEEYVAYYSDAITQQAAETYGSDFAGPYIFACLPQVMGGLNGGGGTPPDNNGNPPDRPGSGDMRTPPVNTSVSNSDIAAFEYMTHSASEAYANPVLHITKSGTYRLSGTWNGQIWLDPGTDESISVILGGVNVTCTVAPAIVFHDVKECGPEDEEDVISFDVGYNVLENAGVKVVIADGTTNNFTGSNVYRMLLPEPKKKATKVDGTDESMQKKRYKMDGAFYSFASMAIGAESENETGTLNITSTTFEGLDAEYHLLIESGKINVTASDDAINVNEDYVSVFTMNGGTMTIYSAGGDGIDSNGYVVVNGGTLNITAGDQSINANGEAGIDAELGTYVSDNAKYNWTSVRDQNQRPDNGQEHEDKEDTSIQLENQEFEAPYGKVTIKYNEAIPESGNDSGADRTIPEEGDIFTLELEVNNFGGVQAK